MSSTPTTAPGSGGLVRFTRAAFAISVVVFLLAGLAIVVVQAVDLAIGNAKAARAIVNTLSPWAFGGASVAGMLSFALEYEKRHQGHEDE